MSKLMTSCVFFRARVRGRGWWSTSCPWPFSQLSSISRSTSKRPSLSRLSNIKGRWRHRYFFNSSECLGKVKLFLRSNHTHISYVSGALSLFHSFIFSLSISLTHSLSLSLSLSLTLTPTYYSTFCYAKTISFCIIRYLLTN